MNRSHVLHWAAIGVIALAASKTFGEIINVPGDYSTIQDAIVAAQSGDELHVAPGIYYESINFVGKSITIQSTDGPQYTTIDAGGNAAVVQFVNGESADAVLRGFTLTNGLSSLGGGIAVTESSPTISNCAITGNTAANFGGGIFINGGAPIASNCLLSDNNAAEGGAINVFAGTISLINATVVGNSASASGSAVFIQGGASATLTNCIVWNNGSNPIHENVAGSAFVSFSNIEGGWPGTGNVNADPFFVDLAAGDLHLGARLSPCIDAGDNAAVPPGVTTDLDGNPRFVDDNGVIDTGSPPGSEAIVDMGAYERQQDSGPMTFDVYPGESIQSAIDFAIDGDEFIVHPGTYIGTVDLLGKAITLRSTDPTDPAVVGATILDGAGAYHVVICENFEDSDTVISGFTIRGGDADGGTPGPSQQGGGMLNWYASPTVSYCTFFDNVGADGGGMCNVGGAPTIIHCIFENNFSNRGGGMANISADPTISNCTFANNIAQSEGAGMWNHDYSEPAINDCTFTGNVTGECFLGCPTGAGGGMCNRLSRPSIVNCLFQDNSGFFGGGMANVDDTIADLDDCTFVNNVSIYADLLTEIPISGGGAIGVFESSCILDGCTFEDNQTESPDSDTWLGASAAPGGALLVIGSSNAIISDALFRNNHTGNGAYGVFDPGNGGDGGAVFSAASSFVSISDSFLQQNWSGYGGGSVFGSSRRGRGGMVNAEGTLVLVGCILQDNEAGGGGAVCNRSGESTIVDCEFLSNAVSGSGGAVLNLVDGNLEIGACMFRDNSAGSQGGAIFIESGVSTIGESIFCENDPNHIVGDWNDTGGNCLAVFCDDTNGNGWPDACDPEPCPADVDGDGIVNVNDLLTLLAAWGSCADCDADINNDSTVDVADLLDLLAAWGPCG